MIKTKILVDGNCIVCDHEMRHYLRVAPQTFEAVDIAHPNFDAKQYNLTARDVNLSLHVLATDGRVLKGVDAFIEIWGLIPRYKWLAKLVALPGLYQYAKFCYVIFARGIRPLLPKRDGYFMKKILGK